ncbi:lipase family alpha/beta hydrolase [Streptomyces sp. NPDC048172]|uniref:lipase family alpha/beta hydrolase n=1 Tax=Streptomyces sp. NPDC048172 TaxID=3365505 RepID=UPI00372301CD
MRVPTIPSLLPLPLSLPLPLRATAVDALVLAGHLLLYPTGVLAERTPEEPTGTPASHPHPRPHPHPTDRPPVLLLHGFCDNRSAYVLLRRSLLRHGWRHVVALNHSPLTGDVRAAARRLAGQVEEVLARTGHERVDLVGHSLGGLIARYYVQRLGGDARTRTVITLGTPHSGTRAAPALPAHPVARQMCPGSPLLAELAEPVPGGCRTRFVSFWSDSDAIMIPRETARLDHSDLRVRNIAVRGVGHMTLPVDCVVSARIRAELGARSGARPASPGAPADVA